MSIINFIHNFPEIKEKNGKYYLYLGIVSGLSAKEISTVINDWLEQDIFKRKILLNKVMTSSAQWSVEENNKIFNKIYDLKDRLSSYFKKESASMILMALFPNISKNYQNKLAKDFSQSKYKNNRKRIYNYFNKNWSPGCQKIIEKAWQDFKDEEAIGLIVSRMSRDFSLKNFDIISNYFNEEDLSFDFYRRVLRNRLYARIYNDIPSTIRRLKDSDPISFIYIKKERREKIDTLRAIEIYKKNFQSRFLARWYSEMGLWEDILKNNLDLLSELKI